jgi:hypothetical protein
MTSTQLLRVLLTALGIYFIGFALPSLIFAVSFFTGSASPTEHESLSMWLGVVAPTISILFGACLVAFRDAMVSRLEPGSIGHPPTSENGSLHVVGISIVGVFFAVRGAADIGSAVVLGLFYRSMPDFDTGLAAAVVHFLLGLAVFLGAPGVVGLWHALRSWGPRDSE